MNIAEQYRYFTQLDKTELKFNNTQSQLNITDNSWIPVLTSAEQHGIRLNNTFTAEQQSNWTTPNTEWSVATTDTGFLKILEFTPRRDNFNNSLSKWPNKENENKKPWDSTKH